MRFLFPVFIVLLLSTCLSQPDCLVTATNYVKISLMRTDTNSVNTVTFLVIRVSGTDSLFYRNQKASSLTLPVNPRTLNTTFAFEYKSRPDTSILKKDSLTLTYVTQNFVISPDCGGFVNYSNLAVASFSFVTEPKVVNPQLSTSATSNLEIKL